MTPYHAGFLASRLLAIVCLIWAVSAVPGLIWYLQDAGRYDSVFEFSIFVPFVAESLLAIALWTMAGGFARALATTTGSDAVPQPSKTDWSGTLFKLLGAYFLILSIPGVIYWLDSLLVHVSQLESVLAGTGRFSAERDLTQFALGLVVLLGARKLGHTIAGLPSKIMTATSLPEVDPPDAPQ